MHRIFRPDGRAVIVAMDHVGFMDRPLDGLIDATATVADCVRHGADAIMTTPGTARACADVLGGAGLIVTVASGYEPAIENSVEQALRMGADALKVLAFPYREDPEPSMLNLAWLGAECAAWGMPLLAETIPGGWAGGPERRTPEALAAGARVGAEAGADFIKTFCTEDPTQFDVVARNCPVPVVILGGAPAGDERALLQVIRDAVDKGAAGVAIGRNIWGHPDPGRIVAAISAVVHDDATVDDALQEIAP
jgi:DhnA family fructose-bisphosphate aldolase class Ia